MNRRGRLLPWLAAVLAVVIHLAPGAARAADGGAKSSRILEPRPGATVPRTFTVKMEAKGLVVEPSGMVREGAGHMHLLVDTDFVVPGTAIPFDTIHLHYGKGQLEATLTLEPGPHLLRLQFADGLHVALKGNEYLDQIDVVVSDSAPAQAGAASAPGQPAPAAPVLPGAQRYTTLCAGCHGDTGQGQGVFPPVTRDLGGRQALVQKIDFDMPPGGGCKGECAEQVADFILSNFKGGGKLDPGAIAGTGVSPAAAAPAPVDCKNETPAPRLLRLLTRREYENTVQDLLGVSTPLSVNQPVATRVLGYDNNASVNVITTRHLDAYLAAAGDLAMRAVKEKRGQILRCDPNNRDACSRQFVNELGQKAYRRPLTQQEQQGLADLFKGAPDFDSGMRQAIKAMLVSPNFLYRSEVGTPMGNGNFKLTPFETASALSYLFLGTMPDPQLFDAAAGNRLERPEDLVAQAKRLLATPRARAQIGVFAGQWLGADPEDTGQKDPKVYPNYTQAVQVASDKELVAFVNHVIFDGTGRFPELFNASYVFANKPLADFYRISGANSDALQQISVPDGTRGGVLGLDSVLASFAQSDDSSPIKRGVFVRKRLLCHELPSPPPAVNNAPPPLDPRLTTRARFASHSSERFCQSCHQYIDGIGFGLERYDGAGQLRGNDNGMPVDDSGSIIAPDNFNPRNLTLGQQGVPFKGLRELSNIVASSPDAPMCLTTQFFRHSRGVQESATDVCTVNKMFDQFKASGFDLKTLLISIVNTPTFTLRREAAEEAR